MKVIKKDGRIQEFDVKKIESALIRSGEKKHAKRIANEVAKKLKGKEQVQSSLIRELVIAELQACKECRAENFINFRKVVRKLSSQDEYLENRIRDLVGADGKVEGVYGGFRIRVDDPDDFDFCGVFMELLRTSKFSVSVEMQDGRIVIVAR
ncbi:MAG: ATP cone domain-containing protein [Candidatus Micrarchaeota archaeon]|nr:ATP cone domain-containing protein [Candidatus Micrarchaeota archaeon]